MADQMRHHEFQISGVEHLATAFGVKKLELSVEYARIFFFSLIHVMSAPCGGLKY